MTGIGMWLWELANLSSYPRFSDLYQVSDLEQYLPSLGPLLTIFTSLGMCFHLDNGCDILDAVCGRWTPQIAISRRAKPWAGFR